MDTADTRRSESVRGVALRVRRVIYYEKFDGKTLTINFFCKKKNRFSPCPQRAAPFRLVHERVTDCRSRFLPFFSSSETVGPAGRRITRTYGTGVVVVVGAYVSTAKRGRVMVHVVYASRIFRRVRDSNVHGKILPTRFVLGFFLFLFLRTIFRFFSPRPLR